MMRGALLSFQLARSKPYCLVYTVTCTFTLLCTGNTAHAVNCQVFLPPFYPRAVHVISRTRLSPVLFYYGFKGRSLYARRGEPGDEAILLRVQRSFAVRSQGRAWGRGYLILLRVQRSFAVRSQGRAWGRG